MLLGASHKPLSAEWQVEERRGGDRFPIVRDLTYRVLNSRNGPETGSGKTINISSCGVLISTKAPLTPGKQLEISINWPVRLDGTCGLNLVARGRVVRSKGTLVAVEIEKYEFRTRASDRVRSPLFPQP